MNPIKKREIAKKKPGIPSLLEGILPRRKQQAKSTASLFKNSDDDDMPSFYGKTEEEGDSFNSSYYEDSRAEGEGASRSNRQGQKEQKRLGFLKYLTWLEYLVIAVELFLIIYTILVLLEIMPIF